MGIKSIKSFVLITLLIFNALNATSQPHQLKGKVIDSITNEALAFVNIQVNDGPEGCITDIDGKFSVRSGSVVKKLHISYIGYRTLEYIPAENSKEILIFLQKTSFELPEIEIKPGLNPANRIIKEAVANRFINDHERLPGFTYTSYDKMYFAPDSSGFTLMDTLAADTNYQKARDFFNKQHLFLMESVVKRSFRFPSENYNKVIASRVSGLSDPLFVFLISQLQSTTFYKEVIKIIDKDYINPISNGCLNKYYFEIQDTIIEPQPYDTTYIISYRPLLNTNFDGLKGTISISTNGFAIRNVIAIPAREEGAFSIKIQQLYTLVDSVHWFPYQLNTDLIMNNAAVSFGGLTLKITGRGKSYISDIVINPHLSRNLFSDIEVDVMPDAHLQSEDIWNKYRIDPLTQLDQTTYQVIDSIGKANNLDKMSRRLNALINGQITLGYVDLYMDNIFKVNRHEGLRLGLKLTTSNKVSNWFTIGGYTAYGLKDRKFKYGAEGTLIFNHLRDFKIAFSYYNDVDENGADPNFVQARNLFSPDRFREIMVTDMDHTTCYKVKLNSRILKYTTLGTGIAVYKRHALYDYGYVMANSENITVTSNDFNFTEASINIRFAYGEKFMANGKSSISLGTKFPILQFSYIHGFDNLMDGQYEYNRYDFKITKSVYTKYFGTSSVTLFAGLIDRDIPYVNLYTALAAYRPVGLYSPGSFVTMRMGEFTADRYASVFLSHNFGTLLFRSKHFNPEPEIVTNLGIGSLLHPENHQKNGIKSYEKGFCESGIVINKILKMGVTDIGVGWFYRYGTYTLPKARENMAWSIAFQFIL